MVDQGLLEQVLRLDERIAQADANPDDCVTLDEDEREVRARYRLA